MIVLSDTRFEEHVTPPGHPERPERAHVMSAVARVWNQGGGRVLIPGLATRDQLALVHDNDYLDRLASIAGQPAMLDADTFTSPETSEVALLAAGATVQAVELAIKQKEIAFAFVRPPGHHAERDKAMGFCLYNNAAVAAAWALTLGLEKVAIVDIDVHHGNGTQSIFYDDPRVLYISSHQFPFYPGTGAAEETGYGNGRGFTFNIPLEAGATDADYDLAYRSLAVPALEQFAPQVTIVSAGYDAHEADPLASMRMSAAGYGHLVKGLMETASRHGVIACVTEGGYELSALTASLEMTFAALEGKAADAPDLTPTARGERAIATVRAAQERFERRL